MYLGETEIPTPEDLSEYLQPGEVHLSDSSTGEKLNVEYEMED